MIPNPSCIPTTAFKTLNGSNTEILVALFSDRIQVFISQKQGKIGNMISCNHEFSQIDNSHTYHIQTLLGNRDDTLSSVYARQIMERIVRNGDGIDCPPLLLGISLDSKSTQDEFQQILHEVVGLYTQAISKYRVGFV